LIERRIQFRLTQGSKLERMKLRRLYTAVSSCLSTRLCFTNPTAPAVLHKPKSLSTSKRCFFSRLLWQVWKHGIMYRP